MDGSWIDYELGSCGIQIMKHVIDARCVVNPNRGWGHFPHDVRSSYECFVHGWSGGVLVLMKWLYIRSSPIMLTIEPILVIMCWERSSIFFEHTSSWYMLVDPHRNTHHSKMDVWLRKIMKTDTSTLVPSPMPNNTNQYWSSPIFKERGVVALPTAGSYHLYSSTTWL